MTAAGPILLCYAGCGRGGCGLSHPRLWGSHTGGLRLVRARGRHCWAAACLIVALLFASASGSVPRTPVHERRAAASDDAAANSTQKQYKICSITGGLDVTRLVSSSTRSFFRGALDDVELIREVVSEAAHPHNGGLAVGLSDLDGLAATLDWAARGAAPETTTLDVGLGYCDDRPDRRIERYVGTGTNAPLSGTKPRDMAIIESVAVLFPWLVDRKAHESAWFLSHQNGRSEGRAKDPLPFRSLYVAAWIGTYGEAWSYYPPLTVYGHPLGFGDVLGPVYDSHEEPFVMPNLPENNPSREAFFTKPYPDTAMPGLSLITAMAPVYLTGMFKGTLYNDTYIASTGVDIAVSSVSTLLESLEDRLVQGSFGMLVDLNFNTVVLSQSVAEKVYPTRTGFEESRVEYSLADGSIIHDRRNQTYLVSDTILQPLTDLGNADWSGLLEEVLELEPGGRGYSTLDLTLTHHIDATEMYVMFERWENIAEWVMLVFAPVDEVEGAIDVGLSVQSMNIDAKQGETMGENDVVLENRGTLDVIVRSLSGPDWIEFHGAVADDISSANGLTLKAGESANMSFSVQTQRIEPGTSSSAINFRFTDDAYPDCFHDASMSLDVTVRVANDLQLNQISKLVPVGLTLMAILVLTSLGFAALVYLQRNKAVIKKSQPFFLLLICLGTFVMGAAIVPLSIDDGNATVRGCDIACQAVPWLTSTGFCVAFSALFSKIWRVNQLFRGAKHCQRMKVTERDVIVPFAVLFTLNFAFLLSWTLADPLRWVRVPVDTDDWDTYGTCRSEGKASKAFLILILITNFAALVLACVEAFKARNISDEYSESKYIGIAVASWLQVFIVGIPLTFIVGTNPTASYFLKSSLIFVLCMSLLLLIFIPKCIIMRKKNIDPAVSGISANTSAISANTSAHGRTSSQTSMHSAGESAASRKGSTLLIVKMPDSNEELAQRKQCGESLKRIRQLEERNAELERILAAKCDEVQDDACKKGDDHLEVYKEVSFLDEEMPTYEGTDLEGAEARQGSP